MKLPDEYQRKLMRMLGGLNAAALGPGDVNNALALGKHYNHVVEKRDDFTEIEIDLIDTLYPVYNDFMVSRTLATLAKMRSA